jgi:S-adenosylmethionine:tRNA ribosyltransferase-isomerase
MPTPISQFDYVLPEASIAQGPAEPRDMSRLMIIDRATGEVRREGFFRDIVEELQAGDVLVFNVSKVFHARVPLPAGGEVFVLRVREGGVQALVRPGKKYPVGAELVLPGGVVLTVTAKTDDGVVELVSGLSAPEMFAYLDVHGELPTPPYVENKEIAEEQYQTMYARVTGSVAAPTAGLHFTPELLERLQLKGVQVEEIVLHVGIGTFRPVQTEHIEDHVMHEEWVEVGADAAERISAAKREGRRIVAVGTTTTRTLEGIAAQFGELQPYIGDLNIFITPGFEFKVIDGLITNFHLPKSTLLMLVSAFSRREGVMAAYERAVTNGYRFFSFGDAMYIR